MTRTHAARFGGTPDLSDEDVPGTIFLLRSEGRIPDGGDARWYARRAHRTALIDTARRRAIKPKGRGLLRCRPATLPGDVDRATGDFANRDFCDPFRGAREAHAVEVKDAVERLLALLEPAEADLLRWRASGTPTTDIAVRLGVSTRTVEARWAALRDRARALLSITL
jgi:DNA-binding CsgD family transcriptional regulator